MAPTPPLRHRNLTHDAALTRLDAIAVIRRSDPISDGVGFDAAGIRLIEIGDPVKDLWTALAGAAQLAHDVGLKPRAAPA
jgi:hypothetical protein